MLISKNAKDNNVISLASTIHYLLIEVPLQMSFLESLRKYIKFY